MPATVLLFSYGTLQKTSVQIATFGRALKRPGRCPAGFHHPHGSRSLAHPPSLSRHAAQPERGAQQ
jgi:hypothetical protein